MPSGILPQVLSETSLIISYGIIFFWDASDNLFSTFPQKFPKNAQHFLGNSSRITLRIYPEFPQKCLQELPKKFSRIFFYLLGPGVPRESVLQPKGIFQEVRQEFLFELHRIFFFRSPEKSSRIFFGISSGSSSRISVLFVVESNPWEFLLDFLEMIT